MSTTIAEDNARIRNLPTFERPDDDWALKFEQGTQLRLPGAPDNPDGTPFHLNVEQAWAAAAYLQYKGFAAPVDVGGGKTLITLLVAHIAFRYHNHQRAMLLVEPNLVPQLTKTDIQWAKQRCPINYHWYSLHKKSVAQRKAITEAASYRPGLYIVPYSLLSTDDGLETLRNLKPDVVIADEAQNLARDSARSKRFWGVMREMGKTQSVDFCALSGTLMKRELMEVERLIRSSLKQMSPIPLLRQNLELWDMEIGIEATGRQRPPGAVVSWLVDWAEVNYPDEKWDRDLSGVRLAYQRRFRSTPAIISSDGASCNAELRIRTFPVDGKPQNVREAEALLETAGIRPDGEIVPTPMHAWHTLNQLAAGFYSHPYWPEPSATLSQDRIERSRRYHAAEQVYNNLFFTWTRNAPLGYDTPREVGNRIFNADTDGIPPDIVGAWHEKKALEAEDLIKRPSQSIWLSDYKMRAVVEYLKAELAQGVWCPVWIQHHAVHDKLAELLDAEGIPWEMVRGDVGNTENLLNPAEFDRIYLLSQKKCAAGLNLQHFDRSIYAQVPRAGWLFHQQLGRMHRMGQPQATVFSTLPLTEGTDLLTLGACLVEAVHMHQVLGNDHKAVLAAWEPPPATPPIELLRAKVPNLGDIDPETATGYLSRFGTEHATASTT